MVPASPGAVGQLPVKGGAAWEQRLALQPVRRAGHRGGPGQGLQGGRGHSVPRGVPPEGGLVLTGGALAVELVLHHGDPAELRTPSAEPRRDGRGVPSAEPSAPSLATAHVLLGAHRQRRGPSPSGAALATVTLSVHPPARVRRSQCHACGSD